MYIDAYIHNIYMYIYIYVHMSILTYMSLYINLSVFLCLLDDYQCHKRTRDKGNNCLRTKRKKRKGN